MTEQECKYGNIAIVGGGRNQGKTLKMYIETLEELEQYRALGTVEELINKDVKAMVDRTELALYKELGTVEELRVARDKQVAKKHHHTRIDRIDDCVRVSICPSCLGAVYTHKEEYPKYCSNCGQKLDWSDEDENNG